MIEVLFIYKGQKIRIQSNIEDKMKDIFNKFKGKIKGEDNLCYIYNGNKINEEYKLNEIINKKNENKIGILVYNNRCKENEKDIVLNQIVCPECKKNILINLKYYKLNLYDSKNEHKLENALLNEYDNIQKLDLSKIICNKCYKNNINIDEELYICNECGLNLCSLCRSKHDRTHKIIKYSDKNSICKKHNERYINYCTECKESLCSKCIYEHKSHNIINLVNIIPNKNELLKELEYMKEIINKFKNNIEKITNILNKVLNNVEIYYKISNNIINNYNNKNRNYEKYYNLNEIKISNNEIINELNKVFNGF